MQPDSLTPGDKTAQDSIETSVRGLGVKEVYSVNPFDEEAMLQALKKAKNGTGVNVVICHAPCAVNERRLRKGQRQRPYEIDLELCNACSLCVRLLGCPGILVTDETYVIDQELCVGCGLCARVCNQDAIHETVPQRR